MKGDFTRFGFDSSKHYSRVLQQQGRVALDSDGNEASAILLHHLRALTRDLFGEFGGPASGGFSLALDTTAAPPLLWISPGHYYVQGILCENDAWADYAAQPDYTPAPADANGNGGDALLAWLRNPTAAQSFWVYLDVWERHVSWIEDESIREPALGGPDTCSRAKVVWQVKALPWDPDWGDSQGADHCTAPLPSLEPPAPGRLAARVDPGPAFTDPCVIAPGASYRGAENHLYRVEVHSGGDATTATFKWSRENGSVATRWLGAGDEANSLVVKSSRGFAAGDWVELSHDALDLAGLPGQLLRLAVVDGDQLTVDEASGVPMAWVPTWSNPKVRRWDQKTNDVVGLRDGAVPITESPTLPWTWIDLEDGVQVAFATGGHYRSGDYWVIPARVATQGIDWPQEDGHAALRPPLGITHALAPLGVLMMNATGEGIQLDLCRTCFGLGMVDCAVQPLPARELADTAPGTRRPARAPSAPAPRKAAPPKRVRRPT
jgi:hypothetical protein